jgi:hypothetical protein
VRRIVRSPDPGYGAASHRVPFTYPLALKTLGGPARNFSRLHSEV